MKFAHPWILWLLPLAWLLIGWAISHAGRRRRALLERFAGGADLEWAHSGASRRREIWDRLLFAIAVSALVVALARPLRFERDDRDELQGAPYLIALDASRSMLAGDEEPSRYGAAVIALDRYLAEAKADHIGLITFAGVANLNAPLTYDMMALRTILSYVNPNVLVDPGSSIASALDRAGRFFRSNSIPERTVVLISDGEELDGQSISLARRLHQLEKVTVHTIGVGTPGGAPVPGWRQGTYQGSGGGQGIVTKLDEPNLRRVANAGGGRYYRLGQNGEGLRQLREEVLRPLAERMARNDLRNYDELCVVPLAAAFLALLARVALGADRFARRRTLPSIVGAK